MNTVIRTLLALAALGLTGAVLVVSLGLYNVSARSGHLPGVSWVLHTTYRNAIRLRAPDAAAVPDLQDEDLIALGARHFDSACAFCHATPGTIRSATALSMVPRPPHVTQAVAEWQPRHLFEIVRGGVKMSGMPHWPATRKDEVWAVVAYLQAVKEGTAPADAHEQTGEEAEAGDPTLAYCASCHGRRGQSGNSYIPRLDILDADYIAQTLRAYRGGLRASGYMEHAAREVAEPELMRTARHFGRAAGATGAAKDASPAADLPGAALARSGTRDVPSCTACHGPGATREGQFPTLAGQSEHYLAAQLRLWRSGARGGNARQELMRRAAAELTDAEISALARYFASLPAHGTGDAPGTAPSQ